MGPIASRDSPYQKYPYVRLQFFISRAGGVKSTLLHANFMSFVSSFSIYF